mgnify:CR=1 FL=1
MGRRPKVTIISYEAIVENMFLGMGIEEQCRAYGVPKDALRTCNNRRAALLKILQVFNVQAILTGVSCTDPGFIRLPVSSSAFRKISEFIEFEEEKLKIPLEAA